ncbi:MAG: hypothetical protein AABY15_08505 [Nanoarchaeota archaeon]
MIKLRFINDTDYYTPWLRKIFNRCSKMVKRRLKSKGISSYYQHTVHLVYAKSLTIFTGGYAHLNGTRMTIKIIRPPHKIIMNRFPQGIIELEKKEREKLMNELPKKVARTFVHELYHCYGYDHDKMFLPRKKVWIEDTYNYDWVSKYPVQFKPPKKVIEKPKEDIRVKRYYRIIDLLKEWQSKMKRAQTKIKTLTVRKKRYEQVLIPLGKVKKD